MQVVFTHYHLNLCGVTQVILNQIGALASLPDGQRPSRVGVLYGGRREGWPEPLWPPGKEPPFRVELIALPSIDYDELPEAKPLEMAAEVAAILTDHGFTPDDTVIHAHNHSLGKNVSWPGALASLTSEGYRLLLQIHDFAEDFRPENYRRLSRAHGAECPDELAKHLYPQSSSILYATLTDRDDKLLTAAGVDKNQKCVLPNPVAEFAGLKPYDETAGPIRKQLDLPDNARLVLYPVRGIRRKNLGELLLYAALSSEDTWHAVTLAPKNPLELPPFERWRHLAQELKLRCLFNTCGAGGTEFLDTLAASDAIITTSIVEGFGMVFLEAWLAGKPLVGRNLPGITSGFKEAGVEFAGLCDSLQVPLDWLHGRRDLPEALRLAYEWVCERYDVEPASVDETNATIDQLTDDDTIDFAYLPSRFQEAVIRHVASAPQVARQELMRLNPSLEHALDSAMHGEQAVSKNATVVRSVYSLATIGKQLGAAYAALLGAPQGEAISGPRSGAALLDEFLRLDRLHSIRIEE